MHYVNEPPHVQLATMSRWYVISRSIHALAALGVANHMPLDEPIDIKTLADATGTKADLLNRVMKFLSAYRLFAYHEPDSYSLTELSRPLRDDDPHSVRDVLRMADDSWWQAFSRLESSLQTGEPAFSIQHDDDFFHFLGKNPDKQANFDRGMAKLSTYDDNSIAEAFDFGQLNHLIDMGGGRGGLLKAIHQHYPNVKLTLFDTPAVISQLKNLQFPQQIALQAGDFLKEIPKADAYLFKGVLHDFSDKLMYQILNNCHQCMPNDASLFIAEQVLPENDVPHPNKTMDIVMMVLLGGRQRSMCEWQKCIEPAGFQFVAEYKTSSIFTLMQFKRKE